MEHAKRRRWWFLPTAALATAALATSSIPAYAEADQQPAHDAAWSTSSAVPAPVSSDVLGDAPAAAGEARMAAVDEDSSVTEYWTPERMESAIPADDPDLADTGQDVSTLSPDSAPEDVPSTADESEQPTVVAEPAPPADAPASPQASPAADHAQTNGKVFFRNQRDGRDYVCSGSAVNSAAKTLVITAGHCVHGGPGETWHANWVFAPGYDHGPGSEATFAAVSFRALDDWIAYGASGRGFNSDVAFVTTGTNENGETVVDAVGGHGLTTGGSREFEVSLFGYPANLDAGERMYACSGTTDTQEYDSYAFPSISGCDFGPGSSGGPWLAQYDQALGHGYVRSVTSFGPANSTEYVSGPHFDERVADLYAAADGDAGGEGR